MKFSELLSRYLKKKRGHRRARNQHKNTNAAVITEIALEPRILLAAADEPPAETAPQTQETENSDTTTGATQVSGSVTAADYQVFVSVNGNYYNLVVAVADRITTDLQTTTDQVFSDSAVFDYDQTATTPIHHPSEYNYSLTRPSDISTENLLLRENTDDSLLPIPEITSHFESLLQILETAPLAESSSSVSSARTTVPEAAISIAETTDLEDNIEVNLSQTKIQQKTASSRLQADSSQPEGIQLPSLTATPTSFTTARAQTVRLRRSGWQRTKNASSRVQSEQALLSANSASNVEDSTNPETWQDSTAATAVEFQRLLNSFVQFDTFESVTSEIARLSDWLTEQLETDRELQTDTLTTDVDPADSYAEQPATQESDDTGNQQPKHAWSRIDFGGPVEHILVTLSESPPDPPEISGLWQQIKFDCNPRGPPCSEGLPASENTRLHSSVSQLQQLRYCIAPRGPSAASVN